MNDSDLTNALKDAFNGWRTQIRENSNDSSVGGKSITVKQPGQQAIKLPIQTNSKTISSYGEFR
jgi:hypothetical protein